MTADSEPAPGGDLAPHDGDPELSEGVAQLFGAYKRAIDEVVDSEPPYRVEERLRRVLDGEPRRAPEVSDSTPEGDDPLAPLMIESAELAARRIVAEAHRRADDIVAAARRRAAEHTSSAVRDAVETLIQARMAAGRVSPAYSEPLPAGTAEPQPALPHAAAQPGSAEDLASQWATALCRAAGELAPPYRQVQGWLNELVTELHRAAEEDPPELARGKRVGHALVGHGFFQPGMLGCTIETLLTTWQPRTGTTVSEPTRAAVVGAVATGFAEHLRTLVRDEQAALQQALHSATEQVELQLRTPRRGGRDAVALFDPLTGLPNRTALLDRLDSARTRAGRGRHLGMCVLDLAGFKTVNDLHGTAVGDRVLARIGRRLAAVVGEQEHLVARLGSDEFALLIEDLAGSTHLMEIADRVLAIVASPVSLDTCHVSVTGRVGLAEAPVSDPGAEDLLRNAQLAVAHARTGNVSQAWFQPEQQPDTVVRSGRPASIGITDFDLRYEPIVELSDNTIQGVDVHVRYRHALLRDLGPDQVTDLSGDSSWLPALFTSVLGTACHDVSTWAAPAPTVNLSLPVTRIRPRQLVDQIDQALDATGLPAHQLAVNIPETVAAANADVTHALAGQLAARGIQIGISHVGLGYSTLAYLRGLPVNTLLLHPRLTKDLANPTPTNGTEAVLRAMVSLAHCLTLKTVACGVESQQTANRLQALHVDFAQGAYYGKPFTANQAPTILRDPVGASGPHRT